MAKAAKTGNSAVLLPVPSSDPSAAAGRKQLASTTTDDERLSAKRPRRQMVRLYADVSSPEGEGTTVPRNKSSAAQNAPAPQHATSINIDNPDDADFQPKQKKTKVGKAVSESLANSNVRNGKRKGVSTQQNMTNSKSSKGKAKAAGPANLQSFSFDGIKQKQNGNDSCTEVIDLASPVATRTHGAHHTNGTYTGMY